MQVVSLAKTWYARQQKAYDSGSLAAGLQRASDAQAPSERAADSAQGGMLDQMATGWGLATPCACQENE
jgi:hypothetical protein